MTGPATELGAPLAVEAVCKHVRRDIAAFEEREGELVDDLARTRQHLAALRDLYTWGEKHGYLTPVEPYVLTETSTIVCRVDQEHAERVLEARRAA